MGKKLIIAPSARRDLYYIVQEIAHDSPERAVKFGDALLDHAEQAANFPRSGRIVPEFGQDDLRELIHAPFRIIYWLRGNGCVEVVRFWHAARGTPET
jgi:toxin ParE1/3/4